MRKGSFKNTLRGYLLSYAPKESFVLSISSVQDARTYEEDVTVVFGYFIEHGIDKSLIDHP